MFGHFIGCLTSAIATSSAGNSARSAHPRSTVIEAAAEEILEIAEEIEEIPWEII